MNKAEAERLRAEEARKETEIVQKTSAKYLEELREANAKIQKMNEEALSKSDEIINNNQEVIAIQNETIKSVTGFGYPLATPANINENEGKLYVFNPGIYNLKNLTVTIYDFSTGLKSNIINNSILWDLLNNYALDNITANTLPPSGVTQGSRSFILDRLYAFEVRMSTDHGEFKQFIIYKYDKNLEYVTHYFFKLFEVDRVSRKFKLIQQEPKENFPEALFDSYFVMHNYSVHTKSS